MDNFYYPPLGFHFMVIFNNLEGVFSFQSVSGLTFELVTETYKEGGQQFDYELPVKNQYPDLVLKRGLFTPDPTQFGGLLYDLGLQEYLLDQIQKLRVDPVEITISLLSPANLPLMNWKLRGAWPKKWSVSDFNAQENQVVIETMEFHYDSFTLVKI